MKDEQGRIIEIRPYKDADYENLRKMYDDFEPKGLEAGLPPPDKNTRHKWIGQMVSCLCNVLALHRGRVIGHAALDISHVHDFSEYLIFIKQGFRDCGIGTRLSEIMKEAARDAGCRKIWLTVRTGNTCAIRVFKKVKFEFTGDIGVEREMELIIKNRNR
ncbi:MAG: GNAT family N-acetyltransferase [Deltaproteobacteria bacterium]|nr:GNAT family N-acetyltransferase [Deltaproteobacteria bacterium]